MCDKIRAQCNTGEVSFTVHISFKTSYSVLAWWMIYWSHDPSLSFPKLSFWLPFQNSSTRIMLTIRCHWQVAFVRIKIQERLFFCRRGKHNQVSQETVKRFWKAIRPCFLRATNCFELRKEVENVKITARQAKTTSKLNKSLGITVYKTFFFSFFFF